MHLGETPSSGRLSALAIGLATLLLAACGGAPSAGDAPVAPAGAPPAADVGWALHGNDYGEQRFSLLDQIDRASVQRLGLAWSFELGTTRGVEASPIVVDGVMYVTTPWSMLFALDARTGAQRWFFDPEVPRQWGRYACCDVVNRGVAHADGRLFLGTLDGRLIAVDAKTGEPLWEVRTTPADKPYTITGAPRVIGDKVLIGNGGGELGVRGFVTAYDVKTGAERWRFYTVPGDPSKPVESPALAAALPTWSGEWWKIGGGGTAWDSMAYDAELNLLYVGVGNGSPWTRYARSPGGGDNLYLSSILALDPDDGSLVWHYQTTPGDNWDYTATQHIMLADLTIGGAPRRVLMQAPKNGFFYVLDRATGELISAEPYVEINWATHVDKATGRPVETELANYQAEDRLIHPGPPGAHNWQPMAFSPSDGLVYIPATDTSMWYANDPKPDFSVNDFPLGLAFSKSFVDLAPDTAYGYLIAWDPIAQKARWRRQHAGYQNGGLLATAGGLVFQGTGEGVFAAYDATTGDRVWEVRSTTGIIAPPVTYSLDGVQYLSVAAGYGGGAMTMPNTGTAIRDYVNENRVLTFRLDGSAALPVSTRRDTTIPEPPALDEAQRALAATRGKALFDANCMGCHGAKAVSSLIVPDLRYLAPEKHAIFEQIVLEGAFQARGMPSFSDRLGPADVKAIHAYVISQAQALRSEAPAAGAGS